MSISTTGDCMSILVSMYYTWRETRHTYETKSTVLILICMSCLYVLHMERDKTYIETKSTVLILICMSCLSPCVVHRESTVLLSYVCLVSMYYTCVVHRDKIYSPNTHVCLVSLPCVVHRDKICPNTQIHVSMSHYWRETPCVGL